jgi:hypothetical protein
VLRPDSRAGQALSELAAIVVPDLAAKEEVYAA